MSHCVQPLLRLHPWSRLQTIWPNLKVHSLILTPHVRTDTCLILPKTPSVTPATAYACHLMLVRSCYFKDFDVSWWFSCESTLTNVVNFYIQAAFQKAISIGGGSLWGAVAALLFGLRLDSVALLDITSLPCQNLRAWGHLFLAAGLMLHFFIRLLLFTYSSF